MLLANTGNSEKEELNYLQTFKKNRVDGVIFMGTVFSREHYKRMQALEVPLVVVGQQVDGYSCVYQDDYKAAKEATEQLLMTGRNIGYIGVTTRDKAARAARKRGFLDAVKGHKPSVGDNSMVEADFDVASGAKKAELLLQQNHEIDSIFCATDNIAIGALQYLNRTGIQVPTEIQLIGFGDTVMGKLVSPAITSIHFFYKTSGIEAARLLLEIIQTGEDLKKEIKMGYRLQIQASTRRVIPLS